MPLFRASGYKPHDFWLADESCDFGRLPCGLVDGFNDAAPIRLHVGNSAFGQIHIDKKHSAWVKSQNLTTPQLVWTKLQSKGQIYRTTPIERFIFSFRFSPACLMIVEWRPSGSYYSVVTMYMHTNKSLNEPYLCNYRPKKMSGS